MICPRCKQTLEKRLSPKGSFFECPACRGRAINWSVTRSRIQKEAANRIWQKAREGGPSAAACPACGYSMRLVALGDANDSLELDVCMRCLLVWFDREELERLPARPQAPASNHELPLKAREAIALMELEKLRLREETEVVSDSLPEDPFLWPPLILGYPVEIDAPSVRSLPWITWGLVATCVVVFLLTWHDTLGSAQAWGFTPAEMLRRGGATIFTAFFLHANIWHLLANTYFLLIFGDNVEDLIGRLAYLGLLLVGQLLGCLAHAVWDPHATVPCVGASAAVSAVMVFYALSFPTAKIGILWHWYWVYISWVKIPVIAWLAIWLLAQTVFAAFPSEGGPAVAVAAHLGGAVAGLLSWLTFRILHFRDTEATQTRSPRPLPDHRTA